MSSEKERKYQKERREWLKAHGICQQCGQREAWNGRTLCEVCIEKRANYDAKRREAFTPEQKARENEQSRKWYYTQKGKGACVVCGKPAKRGVFCAECYIRHKKQNRERYLEKRSEREYVTVWEERRIKNLCHLCGAALPENNPHGRMCAACAEKKRLDLQKSMVKNNARKANARAAIAAAFIKI